MDPFIKGLPPIFMIILPTWVAGKPFDPGKIGPLNKLTPIKYYVSISI
jgi:hypothetical protein